MKADLELTLTYDGDTWLAHNDLLHAMGESFKALDEELTKSIRMSGYFPRGSKVKVLMDYGDKPGGFHHRYFYRRVHLDI